MLNKPLLIISLLWSFLNAITQLQQNVMTKKKTEDGATGTIASTSARSELTHYHHRSHKDFHQVWVSQVVFHLWSLPSVITQLQQNAMTKKRTEDGATGIIKSTNAKSELTHYHHKFHKDFQQVWDSQEAFHLWSLPNATIQLQLSAMISQWMVDGALGTLPSTSAMLELTHFHHRSHKDFQEVFHSKTLHILVHNVHNLWSLLNATTQLQVSAMTSPWMEGGAHGTLPSTNVRLELTHSHHRFQQDFHQVDSQEAFHLWNLPSATTQLQQNVMTKKKTEDGATGTIESTNAKSEPTHYHHRSHQDSQEAYHSKSSASTQDSTNKWQLLSQLVDYND